MLEPIASSAVMLASFALSRMPYVSGGWHAQKIVGSAAESGRSTQLSCDSRLTGLHTEQSRTATLFKFAAEPFLVSSVKVICIEPTKRAPLKAMMPLAATMGADAEMTVPFIRMAPSKSPLAVRLRAPSTRPNGGATFVGSHGGLL